MYQLILKGLASKTTILEKKIPPKELDDKALDWLNQHSVPIAQSCYGEGVCGRCQTNEGTLLCQSQLKNFLTENGPQIIINIAYL